MDFFELCNANAISCKNRDGTFKSTKNLEKKLYSRSIKDKVLLNQKGGAKFFVKTFKTEEEAIDYLNEPSNQVQDIKSMTNDGKQISVVFVISDRKYQEYLNQVDNEANKLRARIRDICDGSDREGRYCVLRNVAIMGGSSELPAPGLGAGTIQQHKEACEARPDCVGFAYRKLDSVSGRDRLQSEAGLRAGYAWGKTHYDPEPRLSQSSSAHSKLGTHRSFGVNRVDPEFDSYVLQDRFERPMPTA